MTPTHLTPEELIDLVEGELDPSRAIHADGCDACRRELASLRESLPLAQRVDVPEPSPLYWPRQTERITTALAEAARPVAAGGDSYIPGAWLPPRLSWRWRSWSA